MPKKTRKAKMRASQRAVQTGGYVPMQRPAEPTDEEFTRVLGPAPVRATPAMTRASVSAGARASAPITTDYRYVFRDLRRIAILAVLFLAIMLILWYLIEVQHIPIIPGII